MLALAILIISGVFILAAMAGLADAIVCFACWGVTRAFGGSNAQNTEQTPAGRITA